MGILNETGRKRIIVLSSVCILALAINAIAATPECTRLSWDEMNGATGTMVITWDTGSSNDATQVEYGKTPAYELGTVSGVEDHTSFCKYGLLGGSFLLCICLLRFLTGGCRLNCPENINDQPGRVAEFKDLMGMHAREVEDHSDGMLVELGGAYLFEQAVLNGPNARHTR